MAVATNDPIGVHITAMAPFSYAQAAKGQSVAPTQSPPQPNKMDSSVGPSSRNMSPRSKPMSPIDRTSTWADDQPDLTTNGQNSNHPPEVKETISKVERSPANVEQLNGVGLQRDDSASVSPEGATPSPSNTAKEDDISSFPNASSDSTWGIDSQISNVVDNGAEQIENGENRQSKESKILKEAPLPPVNFWQQRAQVAKGKQGPGSNQNKVTSPILTGKASDPILKSPSTKIDDSNSNVSELQNTINQWNVPEKSTRQSVNVSTRKFAEIEMSHPPEEPSARQPAQETKAGNDLKQNELKGKLASKPENGSARNEMPPGRDTKSWPTPESAQDEERRKAQSKTDKGEKETSLAAPAKAHGKSWVPIPFIPTVKFNTPLPGSNRRGGGRPGGRGGREASTRGQNSSSITSGKPGSATPATNESSDIQQRGRSEPKSSRASSLPPKSKREGSTGQLSQQDRRTAESSRPSLQDGAEKVQASLRQDLLQHAIPGAHSNNNPTGSVAPNVLGGALELQTSISNAPLNEQSDISRMQKVPGPDSATESTQTSRQRWRNSYHAEGATMNAEDLSDRRKSVTEVTPVIYKTSWGPRRGEDGARPYESYQRGETRPDRGRGGLRNGRGGSQYGNNPHHSSNTQQPNGHLPPIQTNSFPTKGASTYPTPQQSHGNQFGPAPRGYRSGPRSQSIPTDSAYARYPNTYTGMMPLQPQPYLTSPYDLSPMQPPMSANLPYGPYLDQYQLIGMVSFQLEYYFSTDNLLKDMFLRKQMDTQGFVFLSVVAGFNRIKNLTTDLELIKFVCLTSPNIDIRVGPDGRDRLRKSEGWEQFVLEMGDRDPSAQNDGPRHVEHLMTPYPQMFETPLMARSPMQPPDMPHSANASFPQFNPLPVASPVNGLSNIPPNTAIPILSTNEPDSSAQVVFQSLSDISARKPEDEPDSFPDEQIDVLTVVVKNVNERPQRSSHHSAASRTFSDGSIDGTSVADELHSHEERQSRSLNKPNGPIEGARKLSAARSPVPSRSPEKSEMKSPLKLFWVKQMEFSSGTDLPPDCKFEQYTYLRAKALDQRRNASPGECPYDMDVLYQFWSHFLIRNYNTRMYNEFRSLAFQDSQQNLSNVGITNLIKFYSESLASQQPIRNRIARHYVELVKSEGFNGERPAFEQLRLAWRNGALNMKNRKKISDFVDPDLKTELDR